MKLKTRTALFPMALTVIGLYFFLPNIACARQLGPTPTDLDGRPMPYSAPSEKTVLPVTGDVYTLKEINGIFLDSNKRKDFKYKEELEKFMDALTDVWSVKLIKRFMDAELRISFKPFLYAQDKSIYDHMNKVVYLDFRWPAYEDADVTAILAFAVNDLTQPDITDESPCIAFKTEKDKDFHRIYEDSTGRDAGRHTQVYFKDKVVQYMYAREKLRDENLKIFTYVDKLLAKISKDGFAEKAALTDIYKCD
ncbi:hypothetical protein ACFL6Y_11725 [Elusimicrobiota bacterium]